MRETKQTSEVTLSHRQRFPSRHPAKLQVYNCDEAREDRELYPSSIMDQNPEEAALSRYNIVQQGEKYVVSFSSNMSAFYHRYDYGSG